ncbi:MAG: hypothetical protein KBG47_12330 [Bacteroidia bacterium]|jgi:hypothetical protein|nr:hypothetical protein [Bacteroidia bacterium]
MTKINNIIKPVIFATLGSTFSSILILYLFSGSPQNIHWIFSIVFHLAVAIVLGVIAFIDPDPKMLASNLMSISLGRLLVSGLAFLIYCLTFPGTKKWFMVHFMIHYMLFAFFEIVFLIKIVSSKTSNK